MVNATAAGTAPRPSSARAGSGLDEGSTLSSRTLATTPTDSLMELAAELAGQMAGLAGRFVQLLGELDRREGWRAEGATSLEAWIAERCGIAVPTARAYAHVARRLWDLPHLTEALSTGETSFDKVRAVVDVATPERDGELSNQARTHSLRELVELTRRGARQIRHSDEDQRRSLRFNETFRSVSIQLPPESYAEVRGTLESNAREIPTDGETPWDQRLCDAFLGLIRSGGRPSSTSPHLVVTHVPLHALVDFRSSDVASTLAGDLERHGLISIETVKRIACDATMVVAVDDDVGHTMYEGRAKRLPTDAQRREIMRRDRHCRFPGCDHVTFTNVHHIRPWKPDGATDLDNLVLLCEHHHRLVHSRHWTMSGNANEALTFVGPTGRVTSSRPSPLWTVASLGADSEPSAFRTAGDRRTGELE